MNEIHEYQMMLGDEQWQKLEPMLIGKQSDPGASAKNNRLFIEAVLWIVTNNNLWRHLPAQFGKSSTVYMRFRRWNECNFWRQLAQNDVEDEGLQQMLAQIVEYGDHYTRRIEQRQTRKAQKVAYKSAIGAYGGVSQIRMQPAASEESTLHWVALVS